MGIISYGQIDKKLIFIVIIAIARTVNLIVIKEVPGKYSNDLFRSLEDEIGPIIIGTILLFAFKYKQKDKNRKNVKYLIILFFLKGIKHSYEILYAYFVQEPKYDNSILLNTGNGLEIILMSFGTYILLKYKYYIHHYISSIIYCTLGIVIDLILRNYFILNYKYIYLFLIVILNEVSIYCYLKYMMDKLYYHYTEVILYWGITGLLVKLIIYSSLITYEYTNNSNEYLNGIYTYFTETNLFIIIFYQFFYFLSYQGLYHLLIILMLFYLRPNHMIVTDELHVFAGLIIYQDKSNKYYTLIPFVFQILALLFYFEILEFNFCNLNKNTIKNIQDRERKESEEGEPTPDLIYFGDDYYIKDNELGVNNED